MILGKIYDRLFLKFPIYLPVLYASILYNFDNYENVLVFLTLLLLAEPHFGATWPFFLNKKNREYILENFFCLVLFPFFLVLFCIFLFFFHKNFFYLFFLVFNFFHVTKQSIGISKLFLKTISEINFQTYCIIMYGIFFLIIAILRFYFNVELINKNLLIFNFMILGSIISIAFWYILKFRIVENVLTLLTGILIFYPICFVDKPIHGIIMGVTMHYIQYLTLTYKVSSGRLSEQKSSNFFFDKNYMLIIFFYGIIMSAISLFSKNNVFDANIGSLLLIPLIGQILHFYLDSFLWKFSQEHHRDVTLKYIRNKI